MLTFADKYTIYSYKLSGISLELLINNMNIGYQVK
jgi:hypothetical protein